jgi:hypothetical protein
MACKITYQGKEYTESEFMALLYNGELESLVNDGSVKVSGELPVSTQTPSALSSVEATAKALEGKDISYNIKNLLKEINHFTDNKNFKFEKNKGIWFTTNSQGYIRKPNAKIKITRYINEKNLNLATEKQTFSIGDGDFEKGLELIKKQGYDGVKTKNNDNIEYYIFDTNKTKNKNELIAEAYHQAKQDGSDPELVKAVEDLIGGEQQSPLEKAKAELQQAWSNFKNIGISDDAMRQAQKELELIRTIVNYAKQLAVKKYDDIVSAIKDSMKAKSLSPVLEERIKIAESIVNGFSKYSDELLSQYATKGALNAKSIEALKAFAQKHTEDGVLDIEGAMQEMKDKKVPATVREIANAYFNELKAEESIPEPTIEPISQKEFTDDDVKFVQKQLFEAFENGEIESMPELLKEIVVEKQQTAETTGEIEEREVKGEYVKLTLDSLQQIALADAKALMDKFGDDWVEVVLRTFETAEKSLYRPNIARAIGVLNAMSTFVLQEMRDNTSREGYEMLRNLQLRIDVQSNKYARQASVGLNMRRILRRFAMGEKISTDIAQMILPPAMVDRIDAINESLSRKKSDDEINSAGRPTPPPSDEGKKGGKKEGKKPKKTPTEDVVRDLRNQSEAYKRAKGDDRSMTERAKELRDRIKNLRC